MCRGTRSLFLFLALALLTLARSHPNAATHRSLSLRNLLTSISLPHLVSWFYGGERQVRNTYGGPITGYVKPSTRLPGSIMSKVSEYMDKAKANIWKSSSSFTFNIRHLAR